MTIDEAFYKQKEELREAKCKIRQLDRALEKATRQTAADELVQKQLSHIQGLNKKVSQMKGIADRYKKMYESEKATNAKLREKNTELEFENIHLRNRLEIFSEDSSVSDSVDLKETNKEIEALKNEVA